MSTTIYKKLAHKPFRIVGGDGVWLHPENHAQLLDACGGVVVTQLGSLPSAHCRGDERKCRQNHMGTRGQLYE